MVQSNHAVPSECWAEELVNALNKNQKWSDIPEVLRSQLEEMEYVGDDEQRNLYIIDDVFTASEIYEITKCYKENEQLNEGRLVVMIDYLQRLVNKDVTNSERQTVEKNLNALQRIYKELNVAVVCISSLNRLTYGQPIKKSIVIETGQIEYDTAVLIGLQRQGMHKLDGLSDKERMKVAAEMGLDGPDRKNKDGSVSCELVVVKNRNGENADWATNKYIQTGQWIFSQRIDRKYGKKALQAFLTAITEPAQAGNPSPQHGEGRWVWTDVESSRYQGRWFPRVKRVYPPDAYQPMAKDFCIATDHWGKGSNSVNHAVALANYSPYPVLLADTQEKNSLMNQYCEENHICVVPISGMPGDYMRPNGKIIVDRKDSLSELYHNFSKGTSWASYAVAAQLAGAEGKKLVFVIAVDPKDNVRCLDDLSAW